MSDKRTSLVALARPIIGTRATPADRLARAMRSRRRLSTSLRNPFANASTRAQGHRKPADR
jgi:hypothetical protein